MSAPRMERRRHERSELPCTIRLLDGSGGVLAKTKTLNIADGGALLAVPSATAPAPGQALSVEFTVPRSTPNTYMLEQFSCRGEVVRHQQVADGALCGVAVKFAAPMGLFLEV